jgi:hypothetical protein
VHETRFRTHVLSEVGQERDDVVLRDRLDLVDTLRVERRFGTLVPDDASGLLGIMPISAMAAAACASISNQMRKRDSGVQMDAISGRE